jgi:hypothetical protein
MQKLISVKANETITAKVSDARIKYYYDTVQKPKPALFTAKELSNIKHIENGFNDFTVQPLLINYLSRQGPSIAVADINKDGLDDVFIGGSKGTASAIYIQNANETFTETTQPVFLKDAGSEDVAATFFDADNDGDVDLYVGSGGYEFNANDSALQDRLYINDGKGNFTKKQNALPVMLTSTGCAKAEDIDGDGDMDLFVGGRLIPGAYPTTPHSYILLNDSKGNFTDATETVSPALKSIGMVTDAAWVDVNGDKINDLIIVGEWMPVKVFINKGGKLTDASADYIKFESSGWWNRIYAEDMDGDGDKDLVIGNCGLNTQFKAKENEPLSLYYKDFDNNGSIDPVFCYFIGGSSYPAASRDDLADQLPFIKKKFLEYKGYSTATINDIFTEDQLKNASVLKAGNMQTIYLENQGSKGFVLHQLPLEAQYSPVYGITSTDINKDGKKDLVLMGNNTWTRIKFGRYSANHGMVFIGDGKGNFTYVNQTEGGLNIKGNVRSLATIKTKTGTSIIVGINDSPALLLNNTPK